MLMTFGAEVEVIDAAYRQIEEVLGAFQIAYSDLFRVLLDGFYDDSSLAPLRPGAA